MNLASSLSCSLVAIIQALGADPNTTVRIILRPDSAPAANSLLFVTDSSVFWSPARQETSPWKTNRPRADLLPWWLPSGLPTHGDQNKPTSGQDPSVARLRSHSKWLAVTYYPLRMGGTERIGKCSPVSYRRIPNMAMHLLK